MQESLSGLVNEDFIRDETCTNLVLPEIWIENPFGCYSQALIGLQTMMLYLYDKKRVIWQAKDVF
jgi:hypothetical protein